MQTTPHTTIDSLRDEFEAIVTATQMTPAARRSRVWRAPSRETQLAERGAGAGVRLAAASAVVAVIGIGALGVAQLDNGPQQSVAVPTSAGSMYNVVDQINARQLWTAGITGAGVNVAVIDTGVANVPDLSSDGTVRAVVDLTAEHDDPSAAMVDSFGHGTHMAGIVAGRTPGSDPATSAEHPEWFLGVAPDAGIVSVKVAGRDGQVSPEQMIGGIDWVVDHADQLDIGAVVVAFDTGAAAGSYASDPLVASLDRAWNAGVVVVASAGNDGAEAEGLGSPAYAPFVIAVGGVEVADDSTISVPDWTSSGDGQRNPDLVAPGAHIQSLRAPGSAADLDHPEGFVDDQLFLASGSSQAAAVTAGAVALVRSAHPDWTPDQVKQALTLSAHPVAGGSADRTGAGMLDAAAAVEADVTDVAQTWTAIQAPRVAPVAGSSAISDGPGWNGSSWTGSSWTGSSWTGSSWTGSSWTGSSWTGSSWTGSSWTGSSWTGSSWTGSSWTGSSWTGSSWTGSSWTGSSWTGSSWTGSSWTGSSWTGSSWTGSSWT